MFLWHQHGFPVTNWSPLTLGLGDTRRLLKPASPSHRVHTPLLPVVLGLCPSPPRIACPLSVYAARATCPELFWALRVQQRTKQPKTPVLSKHPPLPREEANKYRIMTGSEEGSPKDRGGNEDQKGDESRGVGRFISPRPCCPHTHQPQDTNNKCSQEGDARSKRASLLLYPEGSRESKSGSKVREGERRGIQPEPRPCTKYPAGMTQRFSALWASFRAETTNPIYRSRKLESKSEAYPLDRICTRTPNSNTSVNPGFLRALHSKPKLW